MFEGECLMRRLLGVIFSLIVLVSAVVGISSMLKETRLNRVKATYKSCFASMRVLLGAVEMHFVEHQEEEKSIEAMNDLINKRMNELIQAKYIRESLQDQVQGYFHELPIPKNDLPVCHVNIVADPLGYTFECSLHGSSGAPRPLDDLLKLIKLDADGNYDSSR